MAIILADARQPDLPIVFVNEAFTQQTGYSSQEALGRNSRFLQGPLTDQDTVLSIRRALEGGVSIRCELLNYRKTGEQYWNTLTVDPVHDDSGEITHFISFQRDSSRERAATMQRIEAEKHLASVVDNLPGYIFRRVMYADKTIAFSFVSRSLFRILGLPEDTLWDWDDFVEHIHPDDREEFARSVVQSGIDLLPVRSEYRMVPRSGAYYWFRSDSTPHAESDDMVVWEGIAVDVTAEKTSELKLDFLAHHDNLTGLSNRLMFRTKLIEAIVDGAGTAGDLALFYIDLDEFQAVNEELGQAFGDLMLQDMARRLLAFAAAYGGTVARLGGDEFAILLIGESLRLKIKAIMDAILLELLRPAVVGAREHSTEACVGAVSYQHSDRPHSSTPDEQAAELMKQAEFALRRAKQDGPSSCRIYSADIDERVQNRLALRRSLQGGLTNKQFHLHYQPLVALATGEVVGAEALVRWNHPELGMQPPDLFIPYAESSGLIVPLGAWVLKHAMEQAQSWRLQGFKTPRIAINLSGVQLQRPDFLATVERALDETDANPSDFEFELTERTLIGAGDSTHKHLDSLRKLGFGLAIDDFGTGHSTLKYLRDFAVDKIKIDQTFVRQLVVDSSDASIVRAVISLSRSLRLDVVAEGIETIMQRDFLLAEGCKVGQGYLLSMPLAAEDFGWLLEGHRRLLPTEMSDIQSGMQGI